jgi:protocatechuate 3,4-dioxygenase beta subunit
MRSDHQNRADAGSEERRRIARRTVLIGMAALFSGAACQSRGGANEAAQEPGKRKPREDLYGCEGCEGALERPAASLGSHARMAPAGEPGERMRIEGVVYQIDGVTPAANVVIYAYQTDAGGTYSRGVPGTEASRRHGLLRGWVKTAKDGRYSFDTIKPGPYPGESMPAHVHFTVLEPERRPYWIDDIVFAGEFGVTESYRRERENRGGNGIVSLARRDGIWVARRDIVLEPHPS